MAEEEEQYIPEDVEADDLIVTEAEQEAAKNDPLATLLAHHPEHVIAYAETVAPKLQLIASPPIGGKDPNHKSMPILTTYERTKVIGFRANQLSKGAKPYIKVPPYVKDVSEIARMELKERRLPFIIRRPMPDGTHEYWRLSDLLIL